MRQSRRDLVSWVGLEILPHEREVRRWLRKAGNAAHDVDDIVQEAYCRFAALTNTAEIENGRAYFFRTVRNIALERARRSQIVSFELLSELDEARLANDDPSPERVVAARLELGRIQNAIGSLPQRCREVFQLRRIYGVPQREVARLLGITESVVEMQTVRGLRLILETLAQGEQAEVPLESRHESATARRDDRRGGGRLGGSRRQS